MPAADEVQASRVLLADFAALQQSIRLKAVPATVIGVLSASVRDC